ncbi:hypothetical protein ACFLZG_05755, partial [Thermodesulfobacteriota bacterium]
MKSGLFLFCGAFFIMPMGTSPFTILGGCALILWVFSGEFIRRRYRYLGESWLFPVLAIIGLYWIGLIWSHDPSGLGIKFAKKSHYWLYALAIACIPLSNNSTDNLIRSFLIGLFINALVGLLQFANIIPIISRFGTVYTGFYGGYNTLGILLVLGMMAASFYLKAAEDKKGKIIYAFLMLTYFFHLTILVGRGSYFTFAILSPFIIYNIFHKKGLMVTLIVWLFAIMLMFSSPIVQDRLYVTIDAIEEHFNAKEAFIAGEKYSASLDRIYMW